MCTVCMLNAQRGQRRALDPLELQLEMLRVAMWVLRIELGSSEVAASALNLSPAPLLGYTFGFYLYCVIIRVWLELLFT